MERIDTEPDNLRAAPRWAASSDPGLLQRLEVALGAFWGLRVLLDEAVCWLEPALTGAAPGSRIHSALQISLGWVRWVHQGRLGEALELIGAGVITARALGERTLAIDGLNHPP